MMINEKEVELLIVIRFPLLLWFLAQVQSLILPDLINPINSHCMIITRYFQRLIKKLQMSPYFSSTCHPRYAIKTLRFLNTMKNWQQHFTNKEHLFFSQGPPYFSKNKKVVSIARHVTDKKKFVMKRVTILTQGYNILQTILSQHPMSTSSFCRNNLFKS